MTHIFVSIFSAKSDEKMTKLSTTKMMREELLRLNVFDNTR